MLQPARKGKIDSEKLIEDVSTLLNVSKRKYPPLFYWRGRRTT